ncbi:hypothetical protein V9T40_002230 [Parthenolecanium corni]|uniref:Uncharacterized protein n=1 Tax=Parthenolecanium corni TaxID=536013 RepID=A0AAN9TFX6_9HEMI
MLETNSTATAILKTTSDHNHDECSNSKLQKDAVRKVCKKKAVEDLCEKPSKLIRTALMSTENTTGLVPSDIVSIRQCVYEQRRKLLPRIPKCRSEALEQLKKSSILTSRGEQFLKAFNEKYETDIILYLREIKYICQPSILKSKKPILSCTSNK